VQFRQAEDGQLGYVSLEPGRPVIAIKECPIARPEIMELFEQIDIEKLDGQGIGVRVGSDGEAQVIFESETGEAPDVEIDLPISVASVNKDGEAVTLIGSDHLEQEINGRTFLVSASSFFQVNNAVATQLVQTALAALGPKAGDTVLDLYCGVGLFSAFIAPLASRMIGVEAFGPAVQDAALNLDEFENVELYESPVEGALAAIADSISAQAPRPTLKVILDPPRAGCDKAVIDQLLNLVPERIVYISCDPATLARDAKRLAVGGYRLLSAQPIDMFPQTHHIETLAVFEK
jgi:23S rRNA (uracil1939-C5)-methyltransferase